MEAGGIARTSLDRSPRENTIQKHRAFRVGFHRIVHWPSIAVASNTNLPNRGGTVMKESRLCQVPPGASLVNGRIRKLSERWLSAGSFPVAGFSVVKVLPLCALINFQPMKAGVQNLS